MLEKFLIKVVPYMWSMSEGLIAALGTWSIISFPLTIALMFGSAIIASVLYDVGVHIKNKRIEREKRIRIHRRNKYRTMKSPYDPDFKMILLDK